MDLRLPDLDGTEAARMLRAEPRTSRIPVVAVTALPLDARDDWLSDAGFAGYRQAHRHRCVSRRSEGSAGAAPSDPSRDDVRCVPQGCQHPQRPQAGTVGQAIGLLRSFGEADADDYARTRQGLRQCPTDEASRLTTAVIAVAAFAGTIATPGVGVTNIAIGAGKLQTTFAHVKTGDWKLDLRTKGVSDVSVTRAGSPPAARFGWHSHPGPSFSIVKVRHADFYRGDDRTCTPEIFEPVRS